MTDNLDLAILDAPSAASAPEAGLDHLAANAPNAPNTPDIVPLDEALGLTEVELVEAGIMSAPAERKRKYIPCTGSQISTFLKAAGAGMKDAHFASEDEVDAFVKERGL